MRTEKVISAESLAAEPPAAKPAPNGIAPYDDKQRYIRYIRQRLTSRLQDALTTTPDPDPAAGGEPSGFPVSTRPPAALLAPVLACAEEEFAHQAIRSIFGRSGSVRELIDISEQRANGTTRAAILRVLLCAAAEQGIELPFDWGVVLPRHIDAGPLLRPKMPREEFVARAYETVLRRKALREEIRMQASTLRLWSRSDLLSALAESEEASHAGGEIVFTGLGRRSALGVVRRLVSGRRDSPLPPAAHPVPLQMGGKISEVMEALRQLRSSAKKAHVHLRRLGSHAREAEAQRVAGADRLTQLVEEIRASQEDFTRLREAGETRMLTALARHAEVSGVQRQEALTEMRSALAGLQTRLDSGSDLLHRIEQKQSEEASFVRESIAGLRAGIGELRERMDAMHAGLRPPAISAAGVVVVEVDGFLIGIPASEWRAISYYHHRGPMEPGVYSLFQQLIKPGMVVADIGANVGLYTLLSARLLQGDGRVFSFEPTPATFEVLRNNVQLNGYREEGIVKLYSLAVSDRSNDARLYASRTDSTHNSLYPSGGGIERYECQVRTTTLDDLLGPGAKLDFVKIDVEGAEPFVFRGMRRTLEQNPQMIVIAEFAPAHLRLAGVDAAEFLDEIVKSGLRVRIIDDLTGELTAATPSVVLPRETTNLLLTQ